MDRPSYYNPIKHRMTRRSRRNDYTAPGHYHITMTKSEEIPSFGNLVGDPKIPSGHPGAPSVILTPIGEIINEEISRINERTPVIEIGARIVMPDHIHFIVHVTEKLRRHLGFELAIFKKTCTQRIHHLMHPAGDPLASSPKQSTFDDNYTDTIALYIRHLDAMAKYIEDNPRRRAILRDYPDFFIRHITLTTPFQTFQCFGNPFLLHIPYKVAVKVRSFWSDEEFQRKKEEWLKAVNNGAILISPFYSRREKIVKEETLAMGGSVIIMRNAGFSDRFKPGGSEFELCSQGRLLLMAEADAPLHKPKIERAEALRLNKHCADLASIASDRLMLSIARRRPN